MRDLIKDLKFIITASNDCEKDNKIEQLILDYIKKVETEKAINHTPCCVQLNNKELPTFSEWTKTLKFSSNGIKLYKGVELYNDELIEVYKKEINTLSLAINCD